MYDAFNCIHGDLKRIYLRSTPGWNTLGIIREFHPTLNLVKLEFINEKGKRVEAWFQKFSGMTGKIKGEGFDQVMFGDGSYYLSKEIIFPYEKKNFELTEIIVKKESKKSEGKSKAKVKKIN